jgi:hypothetical protein
VCLFLVRSADRAQWEGRAPPFVRLQIHIMEVDEISYWEIYTETWLILFWCIITLILYMEQKHMFVKSTALI